MDYKSQLNSISKVILDLESNEIDLDAIVNKDTVSNIEIYRNNYFYLTYETLLNDFPVVHKYLGERNFSFFLRKFLKDRGLKSSCLFNISFSFKSFLEDSYNIHEDDILDELATVDLMWSSGAIEEINVPCGLLEFWQELMTGKESKKIINLEKTVKLKLIEYEGEQAIKVII